MVEVKLSATEEERDTFKADLAESGLSKDQIVKKAWETRDAAVKRKNAAEVELAKERISVMQVGKENNKNFEKHAQKGFAVFYFEPSNSSMAFN